MRTVDRTNPNPRRDRTELFTRLADEGRQFIWQATSKVEMSIGRDVDRAVRLEKAGERVYWT